MAKNTMCLWTPRLPPGSTPETFPNSSVGAIHRAPGDYPVTIAGISCLGLNGGPALKHNASFSIEIATDDQEATGRYWSTIVGNGGQESACGRCKDRWGVSWQITPRVLTECAHQRAPVQACR